MGAGGAGFPLDARRHRESKPVATLGELVMILDITRQGLPISAIAHSTGHDRKNRPEALGTRPSRARVQEPVVALANELARIA